MATKNKIGRRDFVKIAALTTAGAKSILDAVPVARLPVPRPEARSYWGLARLLAAVPRRQTLRLPTRPRLPEPLSLPRQNSEANQ